MILKNKPDFNSQNCLILCKTQQERYCFHRQMSFVSLERWRTEWTIMPTSKEWWWVFEFIQLPHVLLTSLNHWAICLYTLQIYLWACIYESCSFVDTILTGLECSTVKNSGLIRNFTGGDWSNNVSLDLEVEWGSTFSLRKSNSKVSDKDFQ